MEDGTDIEATPAGTVVDDPDARSPVTAAPAPRPPEAWSPAQVAAGDDSLR